MRNRPFFECNITIYPFVTYFYTTATISIIGVTCRRRTSVFHIGPDPIQSTIRTVFRVAMILNSLFHTIILSILTLVPSVGCAPTKQRFLRPLRLLIAARWHGGQPESRPTDIRGDPTKRSGRACWNRTSEWVSQSHLPYRLANALYVSAIF